MNNPKLNKFLFVIGISGILSAVIHIGFWLIVLHFVDRVILIEPNNLILTIETILFLFVMPFTIWIYLNMHKIYKVLVEDGDGDGKKDIKAKLRRQSIL